MKSKLLICFMVICFLFSCLTAAAAATSFKCGNTFIKEGLQSIAVLKTCGEPRVKEVVSSGGKSGKGR